MELWEQLLAGAIGLFVIKNAEEKHWGTLALLALLLLGFVLLMIYSVQ